MSPLAGCFALIITFIPGGSRIQAFVKARMGHTCGLLKNWLAGAPFLRVRDLLR
jgi:hypothetical protein